MPWDHPILPSACNERVAGPCYTDPVNGALPEDRDRAYSPLEDEAELVRNKPKTSTRFAAFVIIFSIIATVLTSFSGVQADVLPRYAVLGSEYNFRNDTNTGAGIIAGLPTHSIVIITGDAVKGQYVDGFGDNWYPARYKGIDGYIIAGSDITVYTSYEECLRAVGFPESYISGLAQLFYAHPAWVFKPLFTNRDWEYVLDMQEGKNAVQARTPYPISQYSTLSSKEDLNGYGPSYDPLWDVYDVRDGSNFYYASRNTISYYMDPRNFFVDVPSAYWDSYKNLGSIFMFSSNAYYENQDRGVVERLLDNTFMDTDRTPYISYTTNTGEQVNTTKNYVDVIMEASSYSGASASFIATRMKMEITVGGEASSSVKCDHPDRDIFDPTGIYDGIYNYYNIYAYDSSIPYQNIINGLNFAKYGFKTDYPTDTGNPSTDATNASRNTYNANLNAEYLLPWDTPEKAIKGGAKYLANNYINKGQYTTYLQKWDVNPASPTFTTHQYMSSVHAPSGESYNMAISYRDMGIINNTFEFHIPIYTNMPTSPVQIATETRSENNLLASLQVTGKGSATPLGMSFSPYGTDPYVLHVDMSVDEVTIVGRKAGYLSTVSINGSNTGITSVRTSEENQFIDTHDTMHYKINSQPNRGFSYTKSGLLAGANTFTIAIQSEKGEVRNYTVSVIRGDILINRGSYQIIGTNYITGVAPGTTAEQIRSAINAVDCTTTVYALDGSEATGEVGTGFLVRIRNRDNITISDEIVVIYGDINGDGKINAIDTTMSRRTSMGSLLLTESQYTAADANKDGSVNAIDVTMSRRHTMGTYVIQQ